MGKLAGLIPENVGSTELYKNTDKWVALKIHTVLCYVQFDLMECLFVDRSSAVPQGKKMFLFTLMRFYVALAR